MGEVGEDPHQTRRAASLARHEMILSERASARCHTGTPDRIQKIAFHYLPLSEAVVPLERGATGAAMDASWRAGCGFASS